MIKLNSIIYFIGLPSIVLKAWYANMSFSLCQIVKFANAVCFKLTHEQSKLDSFQKVSFKLTHDGPIA